MKHLYAHCSWWAGLAWLLLFTLQGHAQGYQIPLTGTSSVSACSGTLYDDGGPGGNYSPNADGITTLLPATSGNRVQLRFTTFETETFYDRLTIYDGPSTTDPVLGMYDGTNSPGTVVATNASGALTVQFVSDGVSNYAGFTATISCVPPVPLPDLLLQGAAVTPATTAAGGTVAASVTIINQSVTAASSSSVGYYLSTNTTLDAADVLLGNTAGGTLLGNSAGSRFSNLVIPAGTAMGSYFLLFVADYQGLVNEANEQNNLATAALSVVPPGVDLLITGAGATPALTAPGNLLNLTCAIVNQGTTPASSSNIGFYLSTNTTLDASDQLLATSLGGILAPSTFGVSRFASATIPTGTTPGTYYILFVADYQNQVTELNEQNNVATQQITVAAPSVDLTIIQPGSPVSVAVGGTLLASAYVYNQGNSTASSSSMGVYLSTNTTLDAGDTQLLSLTGTQLGAGQTSFRSGTATIPAATTPGAYFLLFVADPQNAVTETNELNNVVNRSLTVVAPSVDLQVQQLSLSPTITVAGGAVSAFASLFNAGNVVAPATSTAFYFSTNTTLDAADVLLTSQATGQINPSAFLSLNVALTVPAGTAPGLYYILAVADRQNQVSESNEQNNVGFQLLTVVLPRVDLQVVQPGLNPTSTIAGSLVSTFSYVNNIGNTPAPASTLGYYLSTNTTLDAGDVSVGQTAVASVAAGVFFGVNGSFTVPAGTAPGTYYVLFVADAQNVISEINEQNNVASVMLTILTPGVDLTMLQPTLNRTAVAAGATVLANGYITNQGTTTAASSAVGYYLSTDNVLSSADVLLTTVPGGSLAARFSELRAATLTIPAATTPGAYFVLFVADPLNAVTETNELNNVTPVALTVSAPFNGTVVPFAGNATLTSCGTTVYDHGGTGDYSDNANGTLVITPSTAGAKVRVTLTSFSTEQGFDYLRIYDGPSTSSTLLASYTGFVVAGTAVTATNAAGVLTLQFTTDVSAISSGFEAVVSCVGGGTGPGTADLVLQQPSASPLTLNAGASLGVGATIRNQGTGDAMSSAVGYYLSVNNTWDAGDVLLGTSNGGALAAGATASRPGSFTVPATLAAGVYQLLMVADPQNAVAESNEQNNVAHYATPITVTAPGIDLTASQLTVLPAPATVGGTIAVTAFHENIGTGTAAGHTIAVYLSTDNALSANDVLLTSSSVSSMTAGSGITRVLTGIQIPTATVPGTYYVLFVVDAQNAVTETNEQNNVIGRTLQIDRALSVREQAGGYAIRLLPNPTTLGSSFEVRFDGPGVAAPAELTLFNSLGQVVSKQPLLLGGGPAKVMFGTQQLSRGVYTLRITGKGLNAVRRVVVE